MSIVIYNTMSRKKEQFVPIHKGEVKIYVCGPTVYNFFHIGNARCFVVFDVVRRYFNYRGYKVTYVQNITDVDDKIIKAGQEQNRPPMEVAEQFMQAFLADTAELGVVPADVHPRVTDHMDDIIDMIVTLVDKGYAYTSDGDVYFRASSFKEYGKLSHQSLGDLQAGARVEVNEKKEAPVDFALWKAAKPGEISWASPFGAGRPGWHIECSAMSRKYLGDTFDIHGGGHDLVFPHHENEIAQSECATGHPFANYWMHNGFLNVNHEKMSKSLGNFLTVHDLTSKYQPRVLRFFLLSAQYRNPLNFSDDLLEGCQNGLDRIDTSRDNLLFRLDKAAISQEHQVDLSSQKNAFMKAMDDDFNTADAISAVYELVRDANTYLRQDKVEKAVIEQYLELLGEMCGVLGIDAVKRCELIDADIEALILERTEARKARNYARADEIRSLLTEQGIVLEDTAQGVKWKRE
ncbi:MAG: cysS [Bacilli bacterium]|nr:cysS [Bacilli bacterium]